jgi:hypothetical protein
VVSLLGVYVAWSERMLPLGVPAIALVGRAAAIEAAR